jgi:hypothetical protein
MKVTGLPVFLISAIFIAILVSCEQSARESQYDTYANPVNIDYTYSVVHTSRGLSYRSGADPAVVPFRDKYYLPSFQRAKYRSRLLFSDRSF